MSTEGCEKCIEAFQRKLLTLEIKLREDPIEMEAYAEQKWQENAGQASLVTGLSCLFRPHSSMTTEGEKNSPETAPRLILEK